MTGALTGLAVWVGLSLAISEPGSVLQPKAPGAVSKAPRQAVSPESMQEAVTHFKRGNDLVREEKFQEAIPEYKRATELWEHPNFLYNLGLVFRELGMLLEAHERIEAALQGEVELPEEATIILTELEGLLARLEISCDQPGVVITGDGQRTVFTCPGSYQAWVSPGPHNVIGEKEGFIPEPKSFTLRKGDKVSIRLHLRELPRLRVSPPGALSWIMLGAGAATAGVGGVFHALAWNDLNEFDLAIKNCMQPPHGCYPTQGTTFEIRDKGGVWQAIAISSYIAGGVMLASGIILLYRDVSRMAPVDPKQESPVTVMPFLGPDSGGLILAFGF